MLYAGIYDHLVVNGPCPNLFWGKLPSADQECDYAGAELPSGLAVAAVMAPGSGTTKYLGESEYQSPNPALGMVSDSGIDFIHRGVLFEVRARQSSDLAAQAMMDALQTRMMELVGGAILPANPNHEAFSGWIENHNLPPGYDLREEIVWAELNAASYKQDLDPERRLVLQCTFEIWHNPYRDAVAVQPDILWPDVGGLCWPDVDSGLIDWPGIE